jgi:hypothetical protein
MGDTTRETRWVRRSNQHQISTGPIAGHSAWSYGNHCRASNGSGPACYSGQHLLEPSAGNGRDGSESYSGQHLGTALGIALEKQMARSACTGDALGATLTNTRISTGADSHGLVPR